MILEAEATPMHATDSFWSDRLERALRRAAVAHADQVRKSSQVPYVEHPMAVALILDRAGFAEDVLIAGLLHDVVEDTDTTLSDLRAEFGDGVADLVAGCSEVKLDAQGRKRPWPDRKRDHLAALASAGTHVKAIVLADKLHNLLSIALDLRDGLGVWPTFGAARADVLAYYRDALLVCGQGDPRLEILAAQAAAVLDHVEADDENPSGRR